MAMDRLKKLYEKGYCNWRGIHAIMGSWSGEPITKSNIERFATMERKRLVKWTPITDAIANGALAVTFLDDNSTMTFDLGSIPESTREMLFVNGVKQKLADCAADPEVSNRTAYAEMWQRLVAGEYNAPREGGGSGPRMGIFPLAYQRFLAEQGQELSVEEVRERIKTKTDAFKAQGKNFRASAMANPRIAAIAAEIESERKKPVVAATDSDLV